MKVAAGKKISIEYTLESEDRSVMETNVGDKPLVYIHGDHKIIPGLEKALDGMLIGESKQFAVEPEEGFGPVDQNAFIEQDKKIIPPDLLKIGAQIQAEDREGRAYIVKISEIKEDKVVLDCNHPLAGKTLHFDVKIVDVEDDQ